jgi:hypothetical protein
MEVKAYDLEIQMANEKGNIELAKELETWKQNEVNHIKEYYMEGE